MVKRQEQRSESEHGKDDSGGERQDAGVPVVSGIEGVVRVRAGQLATDECANQCQPAIRLGRVVQHDIDHDSDRAHHHRREHRDLQKCGMPASWLAALARVWSYRA